MDGYILRREHSCGINGMTRPFVVLCDLDGVVWLARRPLPRAAEAITLLRSKGHRVIFVTNNSYATRAQQETHLAEIGIDTVGDVISSAMAAASLIEPGANVLVCGGPGLIEAIRERGAHPIDSTLAWEGATSIDVVVVGFHRTFDYEALRISSAAIRRGARFIAANDDPTYPTPDGPIPGGGSIVAAVSVASGASPEIAGKPHGAMAALLLSRVSGVDASSVMIGDRPSTDGLFAARLGCRFALVRSDVSRQEAESKTLLDGWCPQDADPNDGPARSLVEGESLWEISQILLRGV